MDLERLVRIARLVRYLCLVSTTEAGSGHPSSSLSAADLMVALFYGGVFRFDPDRPGHPNNDRLIFSKGHAAPLLYSLWVPNTRITETEVRSLRRFGSAFEGHPTPAFRYAEAATGSLGQGLSIGAGIALNAKRIDHLPYRTYVLLGDGEMAEGSVWEAVQLAAHYRLDNLVGILDVNRLGQQGPTMYGHDVSAYQRRLSAFGWRTEVIDGHSFPEILSAYEKAGTATGKPLMIIAKTVKGKGVSFIEDRNGLHGKPLSEEELSRAIEELGEVDRTISEPLQKPEDLLPKKASAGQAATAAYSPDTPYPTRKAYGNALKHIFPKFPEIVVLDGEVSNSTYSEIFREAHPDRYFEMFIAEQNMVGIALGLSTRGKIPFVSTFAAFLTRAFDQIRMSRYSGANIRFCGSHAGVAIGEDGPSQMGLEDIAMFRSILDSTVLYPADALATEKLVESAAEQRGIVYIRTTRSPTPILYSENEAFPIGGSKTLRESKDDRVTVIAAGITLHEALKAYRSLKAEGTQIRVIDLYSIKPLDATALKKAAAETGGIVTVEDHVAEGGLGEAVRSVLSGRGISIVSLAVRTVPKSGSPAELMKFEDISHDAIAAAVREMAGGKTDAGSTGSSI
ncbi:MAG: transketolase [Desulfobacteraceae bacterium]|nr:MAG: transketolase [Desulfobacteraceae bacterium]